MSMLDAFKEWQIPAQIITVTSALNVPTGYNDETETTGATIYGIKYNRSEAARYFSQTWATNVTDVFVTYSDYGITNKDRLLINGVKWQCSTPINVADQGEVFTIGLERKAD